MKRGIAPALEAALGRRLDLVARALGAFGGLVLAGVALLTCASVIGRALSRVGLGPVIGDFELAQVGCGIAVFSFMPLCQMRGGHVTVDILTDAFPARARGLFILLGDLALALAAWLIASRLWIGMLEKRGYGEETVLLGLPIWLGYAASMAGAAFFFLVALYTIWRDANLLIRGEAAPSGAHP